MADESKKSTQQDDKILNNSYKKKKRSNEEHIFNVLKIKSYNKIQEKTSDSNYENIFKLRFKCDKLTLVRKLFGTIIIF